MKKNIWNLTLILFFLLAIFCIPNEAISGVESRCLSINDSVNLPTTEYRLYYGPSPSINQRPCENTNAICPVSSLDLNGTDILQGPSPISLGVNTSGKKFCFDIVQGAAAKTVYARITAYLPNGTGCAHYQCESPYSNQISTDISGTATSPAFIIQASAGSGGSVQPSGSILIGAGSSQTISIIPDTGNHLATLSIDGVNVSPTNSYTFGNVIANHTLDATFALNTYNLILQIGLGGKVVPVSSVVLTYGVNGTFNIVPDPGYRIADVKVDGVSVGTPTSYTFVSPTSGHTLAVTFSNATSVYRFANLQNGAYLYTANVAEKNNIIATLSATWRYEGIVFYAYLSSTSGTAPVYRFANLQNGAYLYTANVAEKNNIIATLSATWRYEGIVFYVPIN